MRILGVLLLSMFLACSGGEISVRQRFLAQSSVSVQFETWVRALNNRDRDSLALMYHQVPELRVLRMDGTISRGWEEERARQMEFLDGVELVNFITEDLEIEVLDKDMVLTTFRHSLDFVRIDGRRYAPAPGLGSIVWIEDPTDGVWKIHLLQLGARLRTNN